MATFNGEKHVYKQVRSILDQLSQQDELIVSDDRSTDRTVAIIQSFNDLRIRIIQNGNKKGPPGNFGNAISKARGKYIFLADQDDVWLPGKIEKHLALHGSYDLVMSDAIVTDDDGAVLFGSFFKQRGSRPGLLRNLYKNSYVGCCMSFSKKIADYALPFPPGIHMHDWWIGLVAELKGSVFFSEDKLMNYVRHESNASPTLGNSGYSAGRRIRNRLVLLWNLFFLKSS